LLSCLCETGNTVCHYDDLSAGANAAEQVDFVPPASDDPVSEEEGARAPHQPVRGARGPVVDFVEYALEEESYIEEEDSSEVPNQLPVRMRLSVRGCCMLGACGCPGFIATKANVDLCRLCDHARSLHTRIMSAEEAEALLLSEEPACPPCPVDPTAPAAAEAGLPVPEAVTDASTEAELKPEVVAMAGAAAEAAVEEAELPTATPEATLATEVLGDEAATPDAAALAAEAEVPAQEYATEVPRKESTADSGVDCIE